MQISVFGLSHQNAPLAALESLALAPDQILDTLRKARSEGILHEAMILSTCNRTEFYTTAHDALEAERYIREMVVSRITASGLDAAHVLPLGYAYRDQETVRHLLRVAAGLDSMILGETQILGQVKDAYLLSVEGGSAGLLLHRLLAAALRVGKRTRSETGLATGAVSVASAAVQLSSRIFSDLSDKKVLVVGAGETAGLAARHFREAFPAEIRIANRSVDRAALLAAQVYGLALPLDGIPAALIDSDVAICATRAGAPLITFAMVQSAMKERERRPLLLLDMSVPRNVEQSAGLLENVFLHTIESLKTIMDNNLARRRKEVPRVESIVADEVEHFFQWMRSLEVTPLIRQLRDRFERIRDEESARHLGGLDSAARAKADVMARALVNRLLHEPTTRIKQFNPESEDGLISLDTVRSLFDLPNDPGAREDEP